MIGLKAVQPREGRTGDTKAHKPTIISAGALVPVCPISRYVTSNGLLYRVKNRLPREICLHCRGHAGGGLVLGREVSVGNAAEQGSSGAAVSPYRSERSRPQFLDHIVPLRQLRPRSSTRVFGLPRHGAGWERNPTKSLQRTDLTKPEPCRRRYLGGTRMYLTSMRAFRGKLGGRRGRLVGVD